MKYRRRYRMLILEWFDGNSYASNHCFLSVADDKNLLCGASVHDGRSLVGKRKKQSRRKATEVMLELIQIAQKAELSAKYDHWKGKYPRKDFPCSQEKGLAGHPQYGYCLIRGGNHPYL